jgi:S1-C subfamily serine protease
MLLALLIAALPAQERQDKETIQHCYKAGRASMVGLEFHLRKKSRIERMEQELEGLDPEEQALTQLAENQQTFETWGIVVDAEGSILVPDLYLRPKDVEKTVVTAPDGSTVEAKLHSIGRNYDFAILKPSGKVNAAPASFEKFERFELGSNFYVVYMDRVDRQWHLNVSPYIVTNAPLEERKDWLLIDQMRKGALLFDAKGRCVGVPLDTYLWQSEDGRDSFIGERILKDDRILLEDLDRKSRDFQRALAQSVKKVEASLREDRGSEYFDPEERGAKLSLFALPLDEKGTLLIPQELSRDTINKIEEIRVVDRGQAVPCAFVGSFRDFGALIVRADGVATRPMHRDDVGSIELGAMFFTIAIEERFGRIFAKVEPNRLFRMEKGHKGAYKLQPRKSVKPGALILDFEGKPVGFYSTDRKEEDLEEAALEASRAGRGWDRWRNYRAEYLKRVFLFAGLKETLASPAAHFDPRAVPMSKKEEKTLVWLGIEYQEMSKPLAESFGIQEKDLTNDGKRGLLVSDVYPGSPAEKIGLKPDDILLSLTPEGGSAVDLSPETDRFDPYRGYGLGYTPWRPRKNFLTALLTGIGAGKKVSFEVLRGKDKRGVEVTLETSPVDYDTSDKHKDDPLGFTAKELTYEVRYFQKLAAETGGVVVAKVESGSKAEVAKLMQLSIITAVNGSPVRDLAHFKEVLEGHRAAKAKTITLTVQNFGQTKLVDLEMSGRGE